MANFSEHGCQLSQGPFNYDVNTQGVSKIPLFCRFSVYKIWKNRAKG